MRILVAACCLAALAACGFRPVYSSSSGFTGASQITVNEIPGRSGYTLRQAVREELAVGLPGVADPASLEIALKEDLARLRFKVDGAAARSVITARGTYRLYRDNLPTIKGTVESEVAFAVPSEPYGDISAQTGASDRAMRQLAKRIVDDLRLKLATS